MGFFAQYDQIEYSRTKLNTLDKERATKLCRAVCEARLLKTIPSITRWAYHFHELNLELDFDGELLDQVLDWYILHSSDKYTPLIFSASSFRQKFRQIELAMRRTQNSSFGTELNISKKSKRLARELQELNWPKNFSSKLPLAVEQSHTNFQTFITALDSINTALRNFILDTYLSMYTPYEFVRRWITDAHTRICNWSDWSGSINSIIFRVDAPAFERIFCDWCRDYTTDQKFIANTLEVIQRESQTH